MRKNLLSYAFIALALTGLFIQIVGWTGSGAVAAATSYIGPESLMPAQVRLLKSVSYAPDNLLKARAADVRALLNEPELIRQETPVTVWQYRSDSCVLDIYLQSDRKNDETAPVTHYEIRSRGHDVPDAQVRSGCVASLVEQRGGLHMVDVTAFYKAR